MRKKKKILILTYFYLPCNLTAAQRIYGWAKYLHELNYHPIIVTRNWDLPIAVAGDILKNTGESIRIERFKTHEVHYVPYKAGLRDRIYNKFFNTRFVSISKIFTALELFSLGFTNYFIPHSNIYKYARNLLKNYPEINKVIASGKPFDIFKFAYLLHLEFNVPWIADYRDPWNSQHPDIKNESLSEKFAFNQTRLEKRWIDTAAAITTVSDTLLKGIQAFTGKTGLVIMNGFNEEDYDTKYTFRNRPSDELIFTHIGTLPSLVKVEFFIEGMKKLIDKFQDIIFIRVEYIGVNYIPATANLIKKYIKGYENHFILTDRISREEVIRKQSESDIYYMAGHNYKGYPSSKIYEYVGSGKPVVLCPSDNDIMEETLMSTGQGIICNTIDELFNKLSPLIESYIRTNKWPINVNMDARIRFTRKNQVHKLVTLLDPLG